MMLMPWISTHQGIAKVTEESPIILKSRVIFMTSLVSKRISGQPIRGRPLTRPPAGPQLTGLLPRDHGQSERTPIAEDAAGAP
jgi:hypothetical protein